jgi:hypothetical protein
MVTWMFVGLAMAQEPSFVLVDRATWLYTHPDEESRRIRVTDLSAAPPYADPPVVLLEKVGEVRGYVHVRTVPMIRPTDNYARLGDFSYVPAGWSHCYAAPASIAPWTMDLYVRPADLLNVLQEPVHRTLPDGAEVHLNPGLALVGGGGGRWRVQSEHLAITVALPASAVGQSYPAGLVPEQPERAFAAVGEFGRYSVDPQWKARFTADEQALTLTGARLDAAAEPMIGSLADRCVSLTLSTPIDGVPDRPPEARKLRLPIVVPNHTRLTWGSDDNLGRIEGGEYVMWTRAGCTIGGGVTCCDPFDGLEVMSPVGEPREICVNASLPTVAVSRSLEEIYTDVSEELTSQVGQEWDLANHADSIYWTKPTVNGDLPPEILDQALLRGLPNLQACYVASLMRDATVEGRMVVRFGLEGDGSIRGARAVVNDTGDMELASCITNRLTRLRVLDQIGLDPATVNLDMWFDPPRLRSEVAP